MPGAGRVTAAFALSLLLAGAHAASGPLYAMCPPTPHPTPLSLNMLSQQPLT